MAMYRQTNEECVVERDYTEVFDAIARRMFVIGTMSGMAQAELGSKCFSDEQKVKFIMEELDLIVKSVDTIKEILHDNYI